MLLLYFVRKFPILCVYVFVYSGQCMRFNVCVYDRVCVANVCEQIYGFKIAILSCVQILSGFVSTAQRAAGDANSIPICLGALPEELNPLQMEDPGAAAAPRPAGPSKPVCKLTRLARWDTPCGAKLTFRFISSSSSSKALQVVVLVRRERRGQIYGPVWTTIWRNRWDSQFDIMAWLEGVYLMRKWIGRILML